MTQLFQIGDIVRINEPTSHELASFEADILEPVREDIIGQLAVVQMVDRHVIDDVEYLVVHFVTCGEDYKFCESHARELNRVSSHHTLSSQLSLVCGSPYRQSIVTIDDCELSGKPLPLVGMDVSEDLILTEKQTVPAGSNVERVRLLNDRATVMFYHRQSGAILVKSIPFKQIGTPQFSTF